MIAAIKSYIANAKAGISGTLQQFDRYAERRNTVLFWSLAIFYKLVLDMMYIFVASPQYGYAGLIYHPTFLKYAIGLVMYLVLFASLPKDEKVTSTVFLHIQFMYTVAPLLTFYSLANGSNKYILMVFFCVLLESVIVRFGSKKRHPIYITGLKNYVTVLVFVMIFVTVTIPVLYNGFAGLKAFDFDYIYEMRANATYPPGFAYLFFWMGKAIIPFFAVYLLDKKRYIGAIAAIALQLLLYMECGNKYLLFIMIPVIVIYFCAKTHHLTKLAYLGLSVFFLAMIPAYVFDTASGNALGVRGSFYVAVRAVFHPADNKFAMYECFSQFPKMYFSQGLIGKMFGLTNLYNGSEGQIVFAYNGGDFKSANLNTGYLGEAYAQMGFLGMVLMSVLFAFVMRAIESYNSKKNFCLLTAVFAMFIINLNDISLLTTLMSSGMAIVLVLAAVYFEKESGDLRHGI